jgi:hypothetical protein
MFDALRARFGRDSKEQREANRLAKAVAAQKAKEHYGQASGSGQWGKPG